jgi:hypothetical protein
VQLSDGLHGGQEDVDDHGTGQRAGIACRPRQPTDIAIQASRSGKPSGPPVTRSDMVAAMLSVPE